MRKYQRNAPCVAPPSPVNQESRLLDDRGFTPSVLHRQDSEIAECAKPRLYRLGSVKMPIDIK